MQFERIGPIAVARSTFDSAISYIRREMMAGNRTSIAFCNAHTAYLAFKDEDYRRTLSKMLVLNDGVGINIASKLLEGRFFPENLNGTDFVPRLLECLDGPLRIFLLGAAPKVVRQVAHEWSVKYANHCIAGYHHGYFAQESENDIVSLINSARTDILLVGLGNPGQETFIVTHAERLQCRLAIGVGALFDFASGRVARAPLLVRRMHAEWVFRLLREPRRLFKRYTVDLMLFLGVVILIKLRRHLN